MIINEQWKPIPEWDGLYEVSNLGQIRRVLASPSRPANSLLKAKPQPSGGYLYVSLYRPGHKPKYVRIHRVVMMAFAPTADAALLDVNHKNGNTQDNRLGNLEWCTRSDNHIHAYRVLGRKSNPPRGTRCLSAKLNEDQVYAIRSEYDTKAGTLVQIAARYGVKQAIVGKIGLRKAWSHLPEMATNNREVTP